jgi:hypothetical protein
MCRWNWQENLKAESGQRAVLLVAEGGNTLWPPSFSTGEETLIAGAWSDFSYA